MKMLRFALAWLMVFVALAGLNFAMFRAALGDPGPTMHLLALGAMPMASAMLIGLRIGLNSEWPEIKNRLQGMVAHRP